MIYVVYIWLLFKKEVILTDTNPHTFNRMTFEIDYDHLIEQYKKLGQGNLDEFCESYSFAMHIGQDFDSPESRKAMYDKIKIYLSEKELKRVV